MQDPMINNPMILYIKPQTSKPIVSPTTNSQIIMFMIIPLVIVLQIFPFLKNDMMLINPAINNRGMLAYITTKPILCVRPLLYIQALCTQNRSYPTLMDRNNASNVPIMRKLPIIALRNFLVTIFTSIIKGFPLSVPDLRKFHLLQGAVYYSLFSYSHI